MADEAAHLPEARIAVVIPCFRAARTINLVVAAVEAEVSRIYVVDDGCPEGTAEAVLNACADPRLVLMRNGRNLGVGGATKAGYRRALAEGASIVVKLDADGQMDPAHLPDLIRPLLAGEADYTKGNRFAPYGAMPAGTPRESLAAMPLRRRAANRLLSAAHRFATGKPAIADPANGYTAITAQTLARLDLDQLADCYFFETDMLFSLNRLGARVAEVPLPAHYPAAVTTLRLRRVALRFLRLLLVRWRERLRAERSPGRVRC